MTALRAILSLVWTLGVCCGNLRGQTATLTNTCATNLAISLAPYLQAQSPGSVAVQWQTGQPAFGWVEYGETKALGRKQAAGVHGLRAANVRNHRVVLAGLRPGTHYWYRVCFKTIRSFAGTRVDFDPEQRLEISAFQTLPGPQQAMTAVLFNDLHNRNETFQQLRKVVGDTPFDFTFFNGDCLADPEQEQQVVATLAAFTQGVQADSRPVFFLRGNHETRGAFARELPRFLSWPGDKPYFALSVGAVRFLVLDCGETRPDDEPACFGLADFDSYRREQTEWLKAEIASQVFREADWRVLVHHVPLYQSGRAGYSQPGRQAWGQLLAEARIDLALNAHTHGMAFHPANSIGAPYPIVIGGGPNLKEATVMVLQANNHRLSLRVLNAAGGEVFSSFEKSR